MERNDSQYLSDVDFSSLETAKREVLGWYGHVWTAKVLLIAVLTVLAVGCIWQIIPLVRGDTTFLEIATKLSMVVVLALVNLYFSLQSIRCKKYAIKQAKSFHPEYMQGFLQKIDEKSFGWKDTPYYQAGKMICALPEGMTRKRFLTEFFTFAWREHPIMCSLIVIASILIVLQFL